VSDTFPTTACPKCGMPTIVAISATTMRPMVLAWKPTADGTVRVRTGPSGAVGLTLAIRHRFGRTDLRLPHPAECRPVRIGTGTPHAFEENPEIPADFHGNTWCRCGKPGKQGDNLHPDGALPLERAEARMSGERG
jgi:hypothetical protein